MHGRLRRRRARPSGALGCFLAACWLIGVSACGSETIDLLPRPSGGATRGGAGGSRAGVGGTEAGNTSGAVAAAGDGGVGGTPACVGFGCETGGAGWEGPCPRGFPDCQHCAQDEQCGERRPHCSQSLGNVCVECTRDDQCKPDFRCRVELGRCAEPCESNLECYDNTFNRVCERGAGVCVECTQDFDCRSDGSQETSHCFRGECVECYEQDDCTSERAPYCSRFFHCAECLSSEHCEADEHCDIDAGRCEPN